MNRKIKVRRDTPENLLGEGFYNYFPATRRAWWPTGPVDLCIEHEAMLLRIAAVLGMTIKVENCPETVCKNCINEARRVLGGLSEP